MKSKINQNFELILASNSEIRKKILSDLGLKFTVVKPDFDEELAKKEIGHLQIKNQALYLARNKALSITKKFPKAIVIASDQICQVGRGKKNIISKSKNFEEAVDQLKKMNGKIHYQNNAVCLCSDGAVLLEYFERAQLKMHQLTSEQIESYVAIDQACGSAGSYKFESWGRYLFSDIKGNFDCILGMSMQKTISFLYQKKLINF